MSSIEKELAKQAKRKGICEEWYEDLKSTSDIDKMLDMYVRGIDFCLSNDYPTNDYIRNNFKGRMEHKGIHLDEQLRICNEKTIVALGACKGYVSVDAFNVTQVFVKHDSDIEVVAEGNAFVMIDIFDNSRLKVVAYNNAKVCVNCYGGSVEKTSNNNSTIKLVEKHKKTY